MNDKNQVKSVKKAMSILELLGQHNGMGFTEISKAMNLPNTTVHRLLKTLADKSYIRQNTEGQYFLGLGLFRLTGKLLSQIEIRTVAKSFLEDLARKTKESINLAVWNEDEVMCIESIPSIHSLRTEAFPGQRFLIHSTAVGKVLLAFASKEKRTRILRKIDLVGFTKNTITTSEKLREHLELVQKQGFAIDNEETNIGGRCMGVPIKDKMGKVIAAISISGPSARITSDRLDELTCLVKSVAKEISAAIV